MRKDVKKFLFIGTENQKGFFFERAQALGLIHFIDSSLLSSQEIPQEIQNLLAAIKVLRGLPLMEQEENYLTLEVDSLVKTILELHQANEKLLEELRVLSLEISRIEVYGNFSLNDIAYIEKEGKRKIQFFFAGSHVFQDEPLPEDLIYIASDHELDYYLSIHDHPVTYEKMIEMKIDRSLGDLRKRVQEAQKEHQEVESQLRGYAKYNKFLHHALRDKLNHYHLNQTQLYVQQIMEGKLFAVEGWVPTNKVQQIEELTNRLDIYMEEIAIEPTDIAPTYLENQGFGRLGEELVNIYDTPSASDKDPSRWVLWAFTLFFAFIIGDAGYGMIYLALALFLRYKFPHLKGVKKRILNIFTVLCVGCIVWGTLMTSFFGMQIDIHNPIRKLSLIQWLSEKKMAYHLAHQDSTYDYWIKTYPELAKMTDSHQFISFVPSWDPSKGPVVLSKVSDAIMFELALFVGVIHLLLSLLRYGWRNNPNLGWAAFLIGAYLYFPYYLQVPSFLNFLGGIELTKGGQVGLQLMIGGIAFAWLASIWKNGWTGIFEITVLIQVFADCLSYLRLYALGLAGAIVGSTVNEIASGLPFLASLILVMIAHTINLLLGTMGGVIHGLRLNFLEWYHYSFEGGGKKFEPLKLLDMDN